MKKQPDFLRALESTVRARQGADAKRSYVAALLQGGEDALLNKVLEEAGEAVQAAKSEGRARLAEEIADLWFHCLIVMTRYNVTVDDVAEVLARRAGVSGHDEKASRGA